MSCKRFSATGKNSLELSFSRRIRIKGGYEGDDAGFALANFDYFVSTILHGAAYYEWAGFLGAKTTLTWRDLLKETAFFCRDSREKSCSATWRSATRSPVERPGCACWITCKLCASSIASAKPPLSALFGCQGASGQDLRPRPLDFSSLKRRKWIRAFSRKAETQIACLLRGDRSGELFQLGATSGGLGKRPLGLWRRAHIPLFTKGLSRAGSFPARNRSNLRQGSCGTNGFPVIGRSGRNMPIG